MYRDSWNPTASGWPTEMTGFLNLTVAGRDARTWIIAADQIEGFMSCRYDETYERDAKSVVRTKSGESYLVRQDVNIIDEQMQAALAELKAKSVARCTKCNGQGEYSHYGSWEDCPACKGRGY